MTLSVDPSPRVPSFFVVGAQKAGTTSLHNWLAQQPDVCLPRLKETQFFAFQEKFERGIDWYLQQFPRCKYDSVVGEICPEYMFYKQAPYRIRELNPSPKIIFIFRHPIERAFSHYLMSVRGGYEELSFYQALLQEKGRLSCGGTPAYNLYSYMERGEYTAQVKHWREVFPETSFLYIKFDDLIDPEEGLETYRRICDFAGVHSSHHIADRNQASNVAAEPQYQWLRDLLYKPHILKRVLGRAIPSQKLKERIAVTVDKWNQKPITQSVPFEVPKHIESQAKKEIVNLQALTQLDLRDWLPKTYTSQEDCP